MASALQHIATSFLPADTAIRSLLLAALNLHVELLVHPSLGPAHQQRLDGRRPEQSSMALWPFRRRSRRKRPRSGNQSEGEAASRETLEQTRARRRKTEPANHSPSLQPQPAASISTKRQPNKLHRRDTRYSFEEGRDDDLVIHRQKASRKRAPGATSQGPVDPRAHPHSKESVPLNASGPSVLDHHTFLRMPTLHNKRDGEHLAHNRKSSKRRKADHAREAEIKAMSSFEPVRPAAEPWQSGRPIKRDTRKTRTGLGLGFRRSWEKQHPTSDVSLPLPGSIHSSLSSDSEQVSFTVSTLEALAPRPTLSYTVHPRYGSPPPGRNVSVKNKLSEKAPIPEATLKAHKRIDDLANDLTASDLRELMERDERRRARKREQEQGRMEQKLGRRAEKERATQREGGESPPNLERGVLGRESVGLGIEPESAVVTSSRQRSSPSPTAKKLGKRPAAALEDDEDEDEAASHISNGPLDHFHRTDSVPLDDAFLDDAPEELMSQRPVPGRAESPRKRVALMSRKTRSKSPHPSDPARDDLPDPLRKTSGTSSVAKARRSWSNIFRWGSRSKRNPGPSSFSNTSRESMSTHHVPTAAIPAALSRKLSSGVPKRTMSRFREDLPELPVSPPQSPGHETMPPATIIEQDSPVLDALANHDEPTPKRRDTPMSPEDDAVEGVPASVPTSVDPSPEPAAMSLGSVDTEGSWFGQRAGPRRSIPTPVTPPARLGHHRTSSMSSEGSSHHDPDLPTEEIPDEEAAYIADDEYLSHLAHHRSSGSPMTNARPSSDELDDARWGTVGGQQPNVITADFVKSREGLLNTFSDAGDVSDFSDSEELEVADPEGKEDGHRRVTSLDRGDADAKLLEIAPPNSLDMKGRVDAS